MIQKSTNAGVRLSELRQASPGNPVLENLLKVVTGKLELCARLPVYVYEAERAGNLACASAFGHLAEVERRSVDELLACLRAELDDRPAQELTGRSHA